MPTQLLPTELHRGSRPSLTAQATALGRALELTREPSERIVSDTLAPLFLSAANRVVLSRLTSGSALPAVRALERSELSAIGTSALCRHRVIDAALLEALPEIAQVLILGAGYDTRAHRFATSIGTRPVYEVDLAPLSRQKAATVAANPRAFRSRQVVRVETDFRSQPLRSMLTAAGFSSGAPTFVAWEGVSMYLDHAAVRSTLDELAAVCGPGSVLAMDFFRRIPGLTPVDAFRRAAVGSLRLIGEPIRFEPDASAALDLLGDAGFTAARTLDAAAMTRRFATGARHCDEAMYVITCQLPGSIENVSLHK